MMAQAFLFLLASAALVTAALAQTPPTSIEIDLQEQKAYLIRNGRAVLSTPISSGRYGHLTATGSFQVMEKERNHFSTLYGRIEDARGNTVVADADSDMKVPRGGRFVPAPMRYFVRFNNAIGMHAGYLPGYRLRMAASGCRSRRRSPSSMPSRSVRQSRRLAARRADGNWAKHAYNGNVRRSRLMTRAPPTRRLGGCDSSQLRSRRADLPQRTQRSQRF